MFSWAGVWPETSRVCIFRPLSYPRPSSPLIRPLLHPIRPSSPLPHSTSYAHQAHCHSAPSAGPHTPPSPQYLILPPATSSLNCSPCQYLILPLLQNLILPPSPATNTSYPPPITTTTTNIPHVKPFPKSFLRSFSASLFLQHIHATAIPLESSTPVPHTTPT